MKYVVELLGKNDVSQNRVAAISVLDNYRHHRKGQPVIVIYLAANGVKKALLAIGTGNGIGKSGTVYNYDIIGDANASKSITSTLSASQIYLRQIDYSHIFDDKQQDGSSTLIQSDCKNNFGFLIKNVKNAFDREDNIIPEGASVQDAFDAILTGELREKASTQMPTLDISATATSTTYGNDVIIVDEELDTKLKFTVTNWNESKAITFASARYCLTTKCDTPTPIEYTLIKEVKASEYLNKDNYEYNLKASNLEYIMFLHVVFSAGNVNGTSEIKKTYKVIKDPKKVVVYTKDCTVEFPDWKCANVNLPQEWKDLLDDVQEFKPPTKAQTGIDESQYGEGKEYGRIYFTWDSGVLAIKDSLSNSKIRTSKDSEFDFSSNIQVYTLDIGYTPNVGGAGDDYYWLKNEKYLEIEKEPDTNLSINKDMPEGEVYRFYSIGSKLQQTNPNYVCVIYKNNTQS